jgi:hypothetical protein
VNKPNPAWRSYIPDDGGMNQVIADWHEKQLPRAQTVASPSTLTDCPRAIWLKKHQVPFTNDMGWGTKQRLLLGRVAENIFARQLKDEGKLLWHWKDDEEGESVKFGMGEGLTRVEGTPDLLINLNGKVLISDAKTSRADSFAYVPIDDKVWDDELWYHYKLQVECYYMLCYESVDWFSNYDLPFPELCHLFSYALDDGVVKREYTWNPTQKTAEEILYYVKRWNTAYQSETIPDCACSETQRKFCKYAVETETTRSGYKLGTKCCTDELYKD